MSIPHPLPHWSETCTYNKVSHRRSKTMHWATSLSSILHSQFLYSFTATLGGKESPCLHKSFLDVCIWNFPFLLSLISLTRYRERVLRFAEPFLFQRFLRINEQLRAHRLDSNKGTETVDPKDSSRTGFFLGCIPFSVQYDPVRLFCWELFGTTQP